MESGRQNVSINQTIAPDVIKEINLSKLNSPRFVLLVLSVFFVNKVSAKQMCIFTVFLLL